MKQRETERAREDGQKRAALQPQISCACARINRRSRIEGISDRIRPC